MSTKYGLVLLKKNIQHALIKTTRIYTYDEHQNNMHSLLEMLYKRQVQSVTFDIHIRI